MTTDRPAPQLTVRAGTLRLDVVDSHTGGEPTRVILGGFPELPGATLAEQATVLGAKHRRLATAIVDEPRGSEAMVAALLTAPTAPDCVTGAIFFDRSLVLGMCGHGTIGVVETLRRLGRLDAGRHRIDTPAGVVTVELAGDGRVSIANVPSRRIHRGVTVHVDGLGDVIGDIAYGGNVFFLVTAPDVDLESDRSDLLRLATGILRSVHAAGHPEVDHVELFGPPRAVGADSRNFVLCPTGSYDRSPCGTGSSAKVAALAADGVLAEGAPWVQESITGSVFTISYRWHDRARGAVVPTITGSATITGRAELFVGPDEYD